ncbi:MAG: tyrosine-type recombinase/integrase [Phycisphaerae bacterium]|nr:tyrosine-type recombinase/integrase [Phycisphaerae bacterium]
MASIYRRKKGGRFYITYHVRPGQRRTVKGSKDRASTEALARKLESDAMLRANGIIDPTAEKLAANGSMPLEAHIEAFEATLRAKGDTEEHVRRTFSFVRGLAKACGFEQLVDLDAAKVSAHVGDLKRKGMGARSINARLTAFKSLTAWLCKTERLRTDPMRQVAKLNTRTDRRRQRRALSDEELARLIHAAENGPVVKGVTGPDRATLYRVAVETGLRANELRSLTPGSFHLRDTGAATVTVEAAYSKHRREDVLPLRPDLACAIAAYIADRPIGEPLFAVPHKSAEMFRADLRRARAWWIRETHDRAERRKRQQSSSLATPDASGRVVDFHALRHTFITRLARSGVAPAVAKSLARHSTITLTMDHYTHTFIEDERSALARLPGLGVKGLQGRSVRATGTDGAVGQV